MDDDAQRARSTRFDELHRHGPFVLANAWDAGSARLLESMGFPAIATTSSGTALRAGMLDYEIDLTTSIEVAAEIAGAVEVPVSVDFEDGFGSDPVTVAANVERLASTGIAGFSIEDFSRDDEAPIRELEPAIERVAAAADAAHARAVPLVLTARAEALLHRDGTRDRSDVLADVILRLQRYQEAGADVLFAPGLRSAEEVARVVDNVDRPVSVLAVPGLPSIAELGRLGVARVSLGGWLAYAAMDGLRSAAHEVIERGTFEFTEGLGTVRALVGDAFR